MSSTPVIIALNRAWEAVRRNNPDLGTVMIVTGRRRHKSESTIRGQHCRDTWHVHDMEERAAEVWVSGERLAEGGNEVMQTLLHEAAHELARVRKLKDTSNKNRYHNKVFVRVAEELGLEGPANSGGPALGYSMCTIPQATTEVYSREIADLDEACKSFVAPPLVTEEVKVKKTTRKARCECPSEDEITWTKLFQKRADLMGGVSPIMCSICRQPYVPDDDPEEA
jgi:hypothetical protein